MKSEASITKPHHAKSAASWQFQLGCKLSAVLHNAGAAM